MLVETMPGVSAQDVQAASDVPLILGSALAG
jgi:hypothetical protein